MPRVTPCPNCAKPGDRVAGPVLKLAAACAKESALYFVCWGCGLATESGSTPQWTKLPAKPKRWKPRWTKHTPYHWQAKVNGEPIDYWPSKRKWRFQGQTLRGGEADIVRHVGGQV